MARRDPTRSIRLKDEMAAGPPPGGPDSGLNRAMADLSASAEIRDRNQLPSKVKVITPQVILNIVQGVTDRMGIEVDRDEFNQLVMQQTQSEMRLQQTQEKLEHYKEEYKKVYEAWQQTRELLQQAQVGEAGGGDIAQEYEAQIAELQQRNANAVDTYMDLQQQLDQTTEQYGVLEEQLQQLENALLQRDAEIERVQHESAGPDVSAELEQANERINALQAELEQAQAAAQQASSTGAEALETELADLRRKLKDAERKGAKFENLETELEQLRNAEGAWLEDKRRLASQLSNETNNRRSVEEKLEAIQAGKELPAAAKAVEERAKKSESELEQVRAELAKLKEDLAKSGNAAKELGMLKRKFEGVEAELESLRGAEGKWLEDKRRLAAQLVNETNLRQELEKKLTGELAEAKAATEAGKKKLQAVSAFEKERDKALKDRDIADRSLNVIEGEIEKLRAERDAARRELKEMQLKLNARHEHVAKLAPQLNDANKELERLRAKSTDLEKEANELRSRLQQAEKQAEGAADTTEVEKQLAQSQDDNRILQGRLEASRKEVERLRATQRELEELERAHKKTAGELVRVGGALTNAESAAERAREEIRGLREKTEQAAERRHEAEKSLVESRARLESEHQLREEQAQRIRQLEDALKRERETVDSSAPAAALESLSAQLATEREKWERVTADKDREIDDVRRRLDEAELRENELASQLEGIELSKQDVMRAKALAGQRRAQIERMQADVEGARRQAKEAEVYWKSEIDEFRQAVGEHLEAAERGDEGADQRLQKLMETMKVGLADKYAKLRRRNSRAEKELSDVKDKLAAIERILAKREDEERRLRKIIEEMESKGRAPAKKKATATRKAAPKKKGARKK